MLLSGTAAIAFSIAQPASAISINDQVAAAAGGIANYYDAGNQFPNVVSLVNAAGSFCTGSLINSRTILTASHCFAPNESVSISFAPIAGQMLVRRGAQRVQTELMAANRARSPEVEAVLGSASLAVSSHESLHRASSRSRAQPMTHLRQH
jgi:secreted trypsin-like serine protease